MADFPCVGERVCCLCGAKQYGFFESKALCHVHYLEARMNSQWEYIKTLHQQIKELKEQLGARVPP